MAASCRKGSDMDSALFTSLEWRCIGPHRGGRVVAVAGHPTEPGTFYFGGCAGRRLEDDQRRLALGEHLRRLLQDRRRRRARRLGRRPERHLRRHGRDGDPQQRLARRRRLQVRPMAAGPGATSAWPRRATSATSSSTRTNPDLVYVAALGHAWGPNPERGVYRSTDGGETWELVLHKSDRAGRARHHDGHAQPARPLRRDLAGAALPARARRAAARIPASGARSTAATPGRRSRATRACRPACSARSASPPRPAQAGRVWALVEAEDGALFRSDDYGETWERVCDNAGPAPPPVVLHAHLRRPAGRRTPSGC